MAGPWGGGFGGGFRGGPDISGRGKRLPFSGIPPEMNVMVEKILNTEPEHKKDPVEFSQSGSDPSPLTLKRLLLPHRLSILIALVLVLVQSVTEVSGPLLIKFGIDDGIIGGSHKKLIIIAIAYIATILMNGLISYGRIAWTGRLGEKLMYALRIRIFSHLQRLSIDFFTEEMAGRLMTRMTSDIEALANLLHEGIVNLIAQALVIIIVTSVLFFLNPLLALVTILFVTPLMIVLTLWFRQASERGFRRVRECIADVMTDFQENLTGIRIINALNRQLTNIYHHIKIVGRYKDANNYTAKIGAVYVSSTDFMGLSGHALIILIGGKMYLNGSLSIGELTAFMLYLSFFFSPIQQLVQLYNIYQQGQAAMFKLRGLLLTMPSVPETEGARDLPEIEGQVIFKTVDFSYEDGLSVLEDINLIIEPGYTFAFVGETGAGKSTMAKLIIRFYDPTSGQVLIDGHDLKDVTLSSIRRQFGYVPQEPFLFAGTIRDNISFARPQATEDEILEACQAVGINDLIDQLPEGIHTVIHERGYSLSSGERQLLALARAFLARPRVIVLDEATSNLDLALESKIERALDVLLEGRTAVIIAHRLSTAMRADRIAVFHDGRIVELGSHAELISQNGRYMDMYATWVEATQKGKSNHSSPKSES